MLSLDSLKRQAVQWQTSLLNVGREYLQHLFLSHLYGLPESDHLAFKGGTALHLLYGSPRFSEDLDFTGHLKPFHLASLLAKTADRVAKEHLSFETLEAKATSGGFLALYHCQVYEETVRLELNVSLRNRAASEAILVTSPLIPSYQCMRLPVKEMVAEKLQALLFRKKPRDFFDLYFLLRQRLGIAAIIPQKKRLLAEVKDLDAKIIQRELKIFLPVSHHKTIAQLPKALTEELNRL
jgi:predicted nucleotidyltransferase component of viral defense system